MAGCTRWTHLPPPAGQPYTLPAKVRVTTAVGHTFIFSRATIEGDSIFGQVVRNDPSRLGISLVEVRRLDAKRVSAPRTVLAIAGGVLLGGIIYELARPACKDCISLW